MTRPIVLTGLSRLVLLQIRKIATILRRFEVFESRFSARFRALSRGLDDVAIGPPRHHAVLHLAGSREMAREPYADHEQDDGDNEPGDRATAVVTGLLLGIGHRAGVYGCRKRTPLLARPRGKRHARFISIRSDEGQW